MTRSANNCRLSSILAFAAAFLFLIPAANAQSHSFKDAEQIRKGVAVAARKAARSGKSADWLRLAEAYEDAYRFPLSNLIPGEGNSVRTLAVRGQRPREIMAPTSKDGIYRNVYSDKDVCFDADGNLVAVVVTQPVLDTVDVLERAYEAYLKAYETDRKGACRQVVADGFTRLSGECHMLADMAALFGREEEAEMWYLRAARISMTPPCETRDLVALHVAEAVADRERAAERERQRLEALRAAAWKELARGEARYREGLSLLERAQALPAGDDRAFDALQKQLTACFRDALAILEDCERASDDPALRQKARQLLRPLRLYLGQGSN